MKTWPGKFRNMVFVFLSLCFVANVSVISLYEIRIFEESHNHEAHEGFLKCAHHQEGCPKSCICPKVKGNAEKQAHVSRVGEKQASYSACDNHPAKSEILASPILANMEHTFCITPSKTHFGKREKKSFPVHVCRIPFKIPIA